MGDERRGERRYDLRPFEELVRLDQGKQTYGLRDVSYGGMLVCKDAAGGTPALELVPDNPSRVRGRLVCGAWSIDIVGRRAWEDRHAVGVEFDRRDMKLRQALKELIEPIRYGWTMIELAKDSVKEEYRGLDWAACVGDGPTTMQVQFKTTTRQGVTYFGMTIRPRGYGYLVWRDGEIETGAHTEAVFGLKVAVSDTRSKIPEEIVRRTALVLAGLRDATLKAALAPIVTSLRQQLAS